MKKAIIIGMLVCLLLACTGCGNVSWAKVEAWEPSDIYSDREISSAMRTVKNYFWKNFDGCTLTELRYAGDGSAEVFDGWAEQYDADEAIVLYSSFDVGASGGDGSLNPNSTYKNWAWILVRSKGGAWEHKTHGYG